MPPSTITTSGTQSPLVSSALSYPQNADPTTYLPYRSPQIITSSGTWRHPKPGLPISIAVTIIGGGGGGGGANTENAAHAGGGGGAGRINDIQALTVTADVAVVIGAGGTTALNASGGNGGQSSFGTNTATGGTGAIRPYLGTANGGAGSVGGGGGFLNGYPNNGGNGDTYIGGGGGGGNGGATKGTSAIRPQTNQITPTDGPSGVPNGSSGSGVPGLGGLLSQWRPELTGNTYYGDGGMGGTGALDNGTAGKQGAIFIWYNRPN